MSIIDIVSELERIAERAEKMEMEKSKESVRVLVMRIRTLKNNIVGA